MHRDRTPRRQSVAGHAAVVAALLLGSVVSLRNYVARGTVRVESLFARADGLEAAPVLLQGTPSAVAALPFGVDCVSTHRPVRQRACVHRFCAARRRTGSPSRQSSSARGSGSCSKPLVRKQVRTRVLVPGPSLHEDSAVSHNRRQLLLVHTIATSTSWSLMIRQSFTQHPSQEKRQ